MKILVIGGTKFLGYHLTKRLLEMGVEITVFNRGITGDDFGNNVQRIVGDRKNHENFFESFRSQRFDVVVDLIGYEPDDVETAIRTFKDHIGQYIFISTGQVYLVTKNLHQPSTEEDYYQELITCPLGEEAAYFYGVDKRKCEDTLEEAFKSQHFPSVRFRCPIIHGSRDYTLRLYSYLIRLLDSKPIIIPEGGDSIIRHVYVEDVVNAIISVLQVEKTSGKVYNLAGIEVLQFSELLSLMSRILEKSLSLYNVPLNILRKYDIPQEISPFSGRWISYLDPSLAIEEIKFKTIPIEEWLKKTINWFIHEYAGSEPRNYGFREKEVDLVNKLLNEKN